MNPRVVVEIDDATGDEPSRILVCWRDDHSITAELAGRKTKTVKDPCDCDHALEEIMSMLVFAAGQITADTGEGMLRSTGFDVDAMYRDQHRRPVAARGMRRPTDNHSRRRR